MTRTLLTADRIDQRFVRVIEVDRTRTRYYDEGDGPPVVLLSGGQPGILYALDQWSLNIPGLAREFRVIALDKLGQGYTDNPATDEDYTFDAVVRHTVGFLDALDIGPVHLVGHSRGGLLGCIVAHERPDRVKTLTIVDSASTADYDTTDDGAVYAELGLLAGMDPDLEPSLDTVAIEPMGQSGNPETVTPDLLARLLEIARQPKIQYAMRRMAALAEQVWNPSVDTARRRNYATLKRDGFDVPVSVIWGRNDLTASLDNGLRLYDLICEHTAEAELHVLNRAGHCSFRDQADAFNTIVQGFFRRFDGSGALGREPVQHRDH